MHHGLSQEASGGKSASDDNKSEVSDSFSELIDFDLIAKSSTLRKNEDLRRCGFVNKPQNLSSGFVINFQTLLRIHIDDKQYVTIPVTEQTTVADAIAFIQKRRRFSATEVKLYVDNRAQPSEANLFQLTGGGTHAIQIGIKPVPPTTESSHNESKNASESESGSLEDIPIAMNVTTAAMTTTPIHKGHTRSRSQTVKVNLSVFNQVTISETTEDNNDTHQDAALQRAEELLQTLPDQAFNVIKIMKYWRKQERILRLTKHGIENVKQHKNRKEEVTSFSPWENVKRTTLQNQETIELSFKDKAEARTYQSKKATEINDAIQARLRILKDSKVFAEREEISRKFQRALLRKQIENARVFGLGDEVRLTKSRVGEIVYKGDVHFAPNTHYGIALSEGKGDCDGEKLGIRYFQTDPNGENKFTGVLVPESHILRKVAAKKLNRLGTMGTGSSIGSQSPMKSPNSVFGGSALTTSLSMHQSGQSGANSAANNNPTTPSKIGKMFGSQSIEDSIFREVKYLLLRDNTTEGKSRAKFLDKFAQHEKSDSLLDTVREFMNALKAYIVKNKAEEFRAMIKRGRERLPSDDIDLDNNDDDDIDPMLLSPKDAQQRTEEDETREMRERSEIDEILSNLIESALEQTVLEPKIDRIVSICNESTAAETQLLKVKMEKLKKYNQAFFGIKKDLESAENWKSAVYELSLIKDCQLPSEKIQTLVNTAHAVYLSHDTEQKENEKQGKQRKEDNFITGDDFLPIIIYTVVQASKKQPALTEADLMMLEGLVDPDANRSEPGYYLAVFHAATQWIRAYAGG